MKLKTTMLTLAAAAIAAAPVAHAQSPTASGTADKKTIEAKVKEAGGLWEKAALQKDPSVLDGIIADDFVGTSSKGKVSTKSAMYAAMKADTDTYTSVAESDVRVHVFGNNVAVATGTSTEKGKTSEGKEFNRKYQWTDTWMERGGKWQLVASQSALMSGDNDDN